MECFRAADLYRLPQSPLILRNSRSRTRRFLSAIEAALASQGRGETVIEPRVHLEPGVANGHFKRAARRHQSADRFSAGVKVVGDFVDNYKIGFPSELAILALFDPRTGAPNSDSGMPAESPTCAPAQSTAIGAKYLAAGRTQKYSAHIGGAGVLPIGTCACSITCSILRRSAFTRAAREAAIASPSGLAVISASRWSPLRDWQSCVEGADIVVEASRLDKPTPMLKTAWIKKGAFVVPYGTMSGDRAVVDRHHDQTRGRRLGASVRAASSAVFVPMFESGKLS